MYFLFSNIVSSKFRFISPLPNNFKSFQNFLSSASEHQNIRKFKLIKRLASTVLFGSTFLAVLYAKKHKRSQSFDDAKLVPMNENYQKNFKLYEYKDYKLPSYVMKNIDLITNFVCRESDVFVTTFPKTGTTWLQEIIYCVVNGIQQSSNSIEDRFPYLEFVYPGLSSIENTAGQRFIKTHLPYSLLPKDIHDKRAKVDSHTDSTNRKCTVKAQLTSMVKKCRFPGTKRVWILKRAKICANSWKGGGPTRYRFKKILCIMRNPKDVLVSYYHFVRMNTMSDYKGSFENFFGDFLSDNVPYGPIWKHFNEIWEHRDDPNVLILSYEEFHKDIRFNIRKIARFLGKDLSDMEIHEIAEHCSFMSMSENPSINYQHWDDLGIRNKNEAKFLRKGEVGDWKNYLDNEMNSVMDSWIKKHLKDVSILF